MSSQTKLLRLVEKKLNIPTKNALDLIEYIGERLEDYDYYANDDGSYSAFGEFFADVEEAILDAIDSMSSTREFLNDMLYDFTIN